MAAAQRQRGRVLGLTLAMGTRIALLLSLTLIMRLTAPLFTLFAAAISGRDLILIGGGLFLLAKSTYEIHGTLEGPELHELGARSAGFVATLVQIALVDIVFSLDSVITAVGMVQYLPVMILAIVLAVVVMMFAAKPIGDFVDHHPTIKMLALSFLILVGTALVAEGVGFHVPQGYIYFALAFSVGVEMLNIRMRKRAAQPVHLHNQAVEEKE